MCPYLLEGNSSPGLGNLQSNLYPLCSHATQVAETPCTALHFVDRGAHFCFKC